MSARTMFSNQSPFSKESSGSAYPYITEMKIPAPCECGEGSNCNQCPTFTVRRFEVTCDDNGEVLREITYNNLMSPPRDQNPFRQTQYDSNPPRREQYHSNPPRQQQHSFRKNQQNESRSSRNIRFSNSTIARDHEKQDRKFEQEKRKFEFHKKNIAQQGKDAMKNEGEHKKHTDTASIVAPTTAAIVPTLASSIVAPTTAAIVPTLASSIVASTTAAIVPSDETSNTSFLQWSVIGRDRPNPMMTYVKPVHINSLPPQEAADIRAGRCGQLGVNENNGHVVANRANGGLYGWTDRDIKNYGQLGISGYHGQDPAFDSHAGHTHYR